MEDDPIITVTDVRKAGFCVSGLGRWLAAHQLNFRAFLREGLPASTILALDDHRGKTIVDRVRAKSNG